LRRVFANTNITLLFIGQLVSRIGDSMYMIGMMWLVLDLTGSKAAMGTVAALSHLPILLFGLGGGIMADLFNRRRVMLLADLLRTLVVLVLPIAAVTGTMSLYVIYAVTFILAMGAAAFEPAREAIIPDLVPPDRLLGANSVIQTTSYAALLIGPALAAAVISGVGLQHLFSVDSATFFASFLVILFIRYREEPCTDPQRRSVSMHLREIIEHVLKSRRLLFLLVLTAVNNFFIMGPAIVGTPVFVREVLKSGAASYAFVQIGLGVGMIIGAIMVVLAGRAIGRGKLLLLGMIFDGVTHALVYYCGSVPGMVGLFAVHAIGVPFIVVSRTALIQQWVERRLRGRVFSLVNISVIGTTAISCGAIGWLSEYVSVAVLFAVFGTSAALCGVVGWCVASLRRS